MRKFSYLEKYDELTSKKIKEILNGKIQKSNQESAKKREKVFQQDRKKDQPKKPH